MKKWILTLLVASMSLGFVAGFARGQPGKDGLDTRAQRINSQASKVSTRQTMSIVSSQTGLAPDRLKNLQARFPDSGPAGLTIASTLATNTKGSPEQFLNRRASGKSWATIARDSNVSTSTINTQLDRLERSLNSLTPTGRPPPRPPSYPPIQPYTRY